MSPLSHESGQWISNADNTILTDSEDEAPPSPTFTLMDTDTLSDLNSPPPSPFNSNFDPPTGKVLPSDF